MKKVLLFSYHLSGNGGTETVLNEWFKYFKNSSKYELELLIYGNGPSPDPSFLQDKNASMLPYETKLRKIITLYRLYRKLQSQKYDHIICFGFNHLKAIQLCLKLLRNSHTKVYYWTHFRVEDTQFNRKNKQLLQKADGIFSLCEGMSKQFDYFDIDPNKIHTIYNPINRAILKPKSKDGNSFYFIGRLDENQKRVTDIIKALYILNKRENKNYKLTIIGTGDSYDLYQWLIKKYKLQSDIDFIDIWFKDPWEFINEIDCLILSSNFEGFGMVIAESLARGVPVISSDCNVGPSDLILDNITGCLYEVGNVLALKEKMNFVAEGNIATSQQEIANSIEKMYINNYFNRIENILNNQS